MLDDSKLPLTLPEVDKYLPTENGEPPLGRAKNWKTDEGFPLELNTMPGFAGSSAYYLRYMDPKNDKALVGKEANEYWQDVDLYIGVITSYSIHYTKLYDGIVNLKHVANSLFFSNQILPPEDSIYFLHRITSYNVCYTKLLRRSPKIVE